MKIQKVKSFTLVLILTIMGVSKVAAQENRGTLKERFQYAPDQLEIKEGWDNFRERDASIYNFQFHVPNTFVAGTVTKRNTTFFSEFSNKISISHYAKYFIFQLTEEILSEYSGKKIIVPDPDLDVGPMGSTPGTSFINDSDTRTILTDFPYWMKKKFLKYDSEVDYIIAMRVNITKSFVKPVCNINIIVYDNNGKKINSFKHKKKFKAVKTTKSKSQYYGKISKSVWTEERFEGVPIPVIIDIYVQTLEQMMVEKGFFL